MSINNSDEDCLLENCDHVHSHEHDDDDNDYSEPFFGSILRFLGCCFGFSCLPFCGGCCYPYKIVEKGSRGVIQEFGRVKKEVTEGMHYVNPLTQKITSVNMKNQVVDLGHQVLTTFDQISAKFHGVVYYQITDINKSLFQVDDIKNSIVQLAHASLRDIVGKSTLQQCLKEREQIAAGIKEIVETRAKAWGAHITDILIKDIVIAPETMQLLSSVAISKREAEAKIITAEADVKAAKLMQESAQILSSYGAMQIRELEVMERIGMNSNNKIVMLPFGLSKNMDLQSSIAAQQAINEV